MIKRAVVIGVYHLVEPAVIMLSSLKKNISVDFDLIVFYDDFKPGDKEGIRRIYAGAQFIKYEKFKEAGINRFSHMTFSRYECFKLLKKYQQVLWLDVDILVRRNIDAIFDYREDLCAVREEGSLIAPNFDKIFHASVLGLNDETLKTPSFEAGVLLFNDSLKNGEEICSWCEESTRGVEKYLTFADQGILNLVPHMFPVKVGAIDNKYNFNAYYSSEYIEEPFVFHFGGNFKPWYNSILRGSEFKRFGRIHRYLVEWDEIALEIQFSRDTRKKEMILCVIPMKDGHVLKPEVYKSLAMQTVPVTIMPVTRPPLQEELLEKEEKNINTSSNFLTQASTRNVARNLLLSYKGKYVLWHCSDVVLYMYNAVELAIELMDIEDKTGAVYFNVDTKPLPIVYGDTHFDFASALVKTEALRDIVFRSPDISTCNCTGFKEDMIKNGWAIKYLSTDVVGNKICKYSLEDL